MPPVAVADKASANETPISQTPKQRRPNFAVLHARPLPLQIYPLPPLIPHNPLSLLQIAYTYLSQALFPPASHPSTKYKVYFSTATCSVHVTDEETARALWESGFFGKGSLSRSEPNWLDKEKRRLGIIMGETVEERTRKRREERREFKKGRAMKEREAIEEKLRLERLGESNVYGSLEANPEVDGKAVNLDRDPDLLSTKETSASELTQFSETRLVEADLSNGVIENPAPISSQETLRDSPEAATDIPNLPMVVIETQEHLQLTLEEAFFLTYGLGVLDVYSPKTRQIIPTDALFSIFRVYSYFPPTSEFRPDDPFLVSYVVYHHFRSLGWVVRPGIKFAVDYLLYHRGPVFSHAEFAVVILPSYTHPYWHATPDRSAETKKKETKPWWWLQSTNRVLTQVQKSLVLVYVDVPPPDIEMKQEEEEEEVSDYKKPRDSTLDIGKVLKRYRIRELVVKRWMPNRSRD
ncbi:MAG: hypothetical protein MMC33_003784 [Icmadophila ericetorum]|nr:hypothetical protein [Icmadophila ericetorum]